MIPLAEFMQWGRPPQRDTSPEKSPSATKKGIYIHIESAFAEQDFFSIIAKELETQATAHLTRDAQSGYNGRPMDSGHGTQFLPYVDMQYGSPHHPAPPNITYTRHEIEETGLIEVVSYKGVLHGNPNQAERVFHDPGKKFHPSPQTTIYGHEMTQDLIARMVPARYSHDFHIDGMVSTGVSVELLPQSSFFKLQFFFEDEQGLRSWKSLSLDDAGQLAMTDHIASKGSREYNYALAVSPFRFSELAAFLTDPIRTS